MSKFIWDVEKKKKINISMINRFEVIFDEKKNECVVYVSISGNWFEISKHSSVENAQYFIDDLTRDEKQENFERAVEIVDILIKKFEGNNG